MPWQRKGHWFKLFHVVLLKGRWHTKYACFWFMDVYGCISLWYEWYQCECVHISLPFLHCISICSPYVLSNEHQPFTSLSKCLAWRDGLRRPRDRHAGYFLGWGPARIRKNYVFEWGLLKSWKNVKSIQSGIPGKSNQYWQYSFGMMASLLNLILLNEEFCHSYVDCLPSSWCPDRVSHVWMSKRKDALSTGVSFLWIGWSYWMIETS